MEAKKVCEWPEGRTRGEGEFRLVGGGGREFSGCGLVRVRGEGWHQMVIQQPGKDEKDGNRA